MARGGSRRREYVRDGNGRFASTGTTGRKAKPSPGYLRSQRTKLARQRGQTGRLGSATKAARAQLRASRAKLTPGASPQQRAAVTRAQRTVAALAGQRRIQAAPRAGVLRGPAAGKVRKASGARVRQGQTQVMEPQVMGGRIPAAQRPGSITSTLRGTLQALARADAARIREVEAITGQPVRAPRRPAAGTGATVRAPGRGSVTGTIRDGLRSLAQSDARTAREIDAILKGSPTGALKGSGSSGGKRRRVRGSEPAPKALPPGPDKPVTRGKAAPASTPAPAKPKPARPASKVVAPGRRRKVKGPSRRTPGTIAKPKGWRPGTLAKRRGRKAPKKPKSAAQAVAQANMLLDKLKMQRMEVGGTMARYRIEDRIDRVNQAIKKIVPSYRHNPTRRGGLAKAAFEERNRRYGRDARARNNIGRLYG